MMYSAMCFEAAICESRMMSLMANICDLVDLRLLEMVEASFLSVTWATENNSEQDHSIFLCPHQTVLYGTIPYVLPIGHRVRTR
jgi:hypothetical protein